ncbi:ATP-binding protein [Luteolibacter algae]|uniref:ATP-binding protein n=1 Tax=Luteolibacter algae TaxID=454151 RepID=A0ABW5DAS1_9BACT
MSNLHLQTNLSGRLRNTSLPQSSGLLPLFEAVVNSIHAIEETGKEIDQGTIRVKILRNDRTEDLKLNDSKKPGREAKEEIYGFVVSDNGIGFNDTNMTSFQTLDSDHKVEIGGRGVGRLLWLKAFTSIKVKSFFQDKDGELCRRTFKFSEVEAVSDLNEEHSEDGSTTGSFVELEGFKSRYRKASKKTGKAIAEAIVEHCLWYFLRPGGAPDIRVEDEDESFLISENFEDLLVDTPTPETIKVKGQEFDLVHVKRTTATNTGHSLVFCADKRVVDEEKISGKVPGLHGKIHEGDQSYFYSCYVSSKFLDANVRSERTGFDIPETVEELFEDSEVTFENIKEAVTEKIGDHLKSQLSKNRESSRERIDTFIANRAPRYRPILSRISEEQLDIDPSASDKEVELTLHKHLASLEAELLNDGHDILSASPGDDFDDYESRLKDYLSKAEDIKRSDLAGYVSHRRVILDLLQKAIQTDSHGKYSREDLIHKLIMPMQTDSNEAALNAGNLWLIDERLAFHNYLASDKTIRSMPITGATETKEPDICSLNVFDVPVLFSDSSTLPPASLEVIELKRPMRNDVRSGEDKDPIEQALRYLDRIRLGEITTATGRPITGSQDIPGFCYIIADITKTMIYQCEKIHDLTRTSDGSGYFGYKKSLKAYIEVISFDRLLQMSKERNRAFFDKLGLPSA